MDIKLAVALPLFNDREYSQFWDSFLIMEKPERFSYLRPDFPGRMDATRNILVKSALEKGCSHIIFMDTDQIYPSNTIPKLFQTLEACNCKVAGTVVYRRYIPFEPLVFTIEEGGLVRVDYEKIYQQEFLKVDAIGAGCVLYDLDIFRAIPSPWFEDQTHIVDEKTKRRGPGEDIGFCYKLREYGFEIFLNTSLDIGHISTLNINKAFFHVLSLIQKAVRQPPLTIEKE